MGGDAHHVDPAEPSPEKIRQILARAATQKPSELPSWPSHMNGGVFPINLRGRFSKERERLLYPAEFNDVQRKWRAKWIRAQLLHPQEPFEVPAYEKERYNPIRQVLRLPMNYVERRFFRRFLSYDVAKNFRKSLKFAFGGYLGFLYLYYLLKYESNNWESERTIKVTAPKEVILPGDPRWPMPNEKPNSWQHFDHKFSKRTVFLAPDSHWVADD